MATHVTQDTRFNPPNLVHVTRGRLACGLWDVHQSSHCKCISKFRVFNEKSNCEHCQPFVVLCYWCAIVRMGSDVFTCERTLILTQEHNKLTNTRILFSFSLTHETYKGVFSQYSEAHLECIENVDGCHHDSLNSG